MGWLTNMIVYILEANRDDWTIYMETWSTSQEGGGIALKDCWWLVISWIIKNLQEDVK